MNCVKFPYILKGANVVPVFKKDYRGSKETIVQLVNCLQCQRLLKICYVNNVYIVCRSKSFKIPVRLYKRFLCTIFLSSNAREKERCG